MRLAVRREAPGRSRRHGHYESKHRAREDVARRSGGRGAWSGCGSWRGRRRSRRQRARSWRSRTGSVRRRGPGSQVGAGGGPGAGSGYSGGPRPCPLRFPRAPRRPAPGWGYTALVGKSASQVQGDLETSSSRSILASLGSAAHCQEVRAAVAVVLGFSDMSSYRRLAKNVLGMPSSSVRGRGGRNYVATVIAETFAHGRVGRAPIR